MSKKKTSKKNKWIGHFGSRKLTEKILSREAVIVYSPKLKKIVWTNTSGAMLFGGASIDEFVASSIKSDHPFLAQVKASVRQLRGERIHRGFRVVNSGHSRFIQCEIGYIKISGLGKRKGSKKAIIISAANPVISKMPEHEFAAEVIANMADLGPARAICDEYGLAIAANDEFAQAELKPEVLEQLCSDVSDQQQTVVNSAADTDLPIDLYVLGDNPKRVLVVAGLADTKSDDVVSEEMQVENKNGRKPDIDTIITPPAFDPVDKEVTAQQQDEKEELEQVIEPAELQIASGHDEISEELDDAIEEHESEIVAEDEFDEDQIAIRVDNGDEDPVNEVEEHADLVDSDIINTLEEEIPEGLEDFVFNAESEPVRFAWTTNNNQEFTSVSDDLANAVGPNAADIIGRKWSDVATVFGFDNNGEINSLLQKQDTWSGKSVLWPVQGTDLHVPVDLAALPTFSSGRNFDGFRGFGIVRMLDTVVDPDATGMALVGSRQQTHADSELDEKIQDRLQEQPSAPETEPYQSDNIVDLSKRRNKGREDADQHNHEEGELTSRENRAFHEIGQKLRDSSKFGNSPPYQGRDDTVEKAAEPITVDTSILSELPIPVLVFRGDETLFANQELLNITGYRDLDELEQAGGLNALFADDDPDQAEDQSDIILNDCDGGKMKVMAHLKSVPWDGENAMLLSVRQPKHETLPEDEKVLLDKIRVSELNNILDTATDGIIILDKEGIVQSLNQSAEALFDRPEQDVVDKSINILFAGESHSKIDNLLSDLRDANAHRLLNEGCEVIGVEAKGGLIPLYITVGSVGASDKFCAILRDMTPWKKTREELVEARKQAETASEQKTEFLARISHEIRTPLNAIIGFSDVMIEERFGPIDNERYREYLRDINRSGIHVLDLINDLLDISKIEAGKMELAFEAVDLNQIVAETVALLQPQANGNRVLIRTSLSRAVPNVVADARSIRQIVLNLVSNAIKFTEANGQVIVSTVYEGNGEVALRVRDTGRGMSEEDISIALKPFRQLNAISETRGQGTGLGLPLTKALVEANKAYFDIESEPGEGTIVLIQFPTQRVLAD